MGKAKLGICRRVHMLCHHKESEIRKAQCFVMLSREMDLFGHINGIGGPSKEFWIKHGKSAKLVLFDEWIQWIQQPWFESRSA